MSPTRAQCLFLSHQRLASRLRITGTRNKPLTKQATMLRSLEEDDQAYPRLDIGETSSDQDSDIYASFETTPVVCSKIQFWRTGPRQKIKTAKNTPKKDEIGASHWYRKRATTVVGEDLVHPKRGRPLSLWVNSPKLRHVLEQSKRRVCYVVSRFAARISLVNLKLHPASARLVPKPARAGVPLSQLQAIGLSNRDIPFQVC